MARHSRVVAAIRRLLHLDTDHVDRDVAGIEAGRLCREKIRSCHLSFVYGAGQMLVSDRSEACLNPIVQFLEEGEQFIIFRESQVVRP